MAPSGAQTGTWPVSTDLTRDQLSRRVAHTPTENTLLEQNPCKEPAAAWTSRVHGAESGSEKQSEPRRSRACRCFAGTTKTGHSQSPFSRWGGGFLGPPVSAPNSQGPQPLPQAPRAPFPRFQLRRSGVGQKDLPCPPAILRHSPLFLRWAGPCGVSWERNLTPRTGKSGRENQSGHRGGVSPEGTSGEEGQVEQHSPCWRPQEHWPGADPNLAQGAGWPVPQGPRSVLPERLHDSLELAKKD